MTAPFPKEEIEGSIPERFRRVARANPERAAVRDAGRVVSYAELETLAAAASANLAQCLAGSRPDAPVALFAKAGASLFAAMLGALEAVRFYVPLDPALPDARLSPILDDLDAAAVVADGSELARVRGLVRPDVPVLPLEELLAGPAPSDIPSQASPSPGDLAYVLFTSGSTGRPKGVMQSHRNVLHGAWKLAHGLVITADDRITLLSSPSFGASTSDIYGALLTGASVCPFELSGEGLRRLPEFLEREAITIYHSVPSVFRSLSTTLDGRADISSVRLIKLGGEAVLASDFELYRRRFPRSCVFHVGLGSTEVSIIRQWFATHDTPWPGGTPLGYAVDDTEVVLLGEDGAPNGADEGEIGVVAPTLPVGYWKDPERTASALVPAPGRPGARMYRTGDLGRLLPDGCLLHLGRRDDRLKIRGHRVEASEVEAALLAVPGVREAAVDGRPSSGGMRLTAWVSGGPGVAALRRAVARALPASMVPSAFVRVDALPRTPTGKVDRGALPEPESGRPDLEVPYREPRAGREAEIAGAFARVLGLDRAGADDDFFDLGGDSLSAVELLAVISERTGAEISAADLIEAPTPATLARRAGGTLPTRIVRLSEGAGRPVFVVPGGAGDDEDLFAARRLARVTGGDSPFLALRSGPSPHPPVEDLARAWVREVRATAPGPYALVGDCMGGILAFAMAERLRAEGERVALLALMDTPFPQAGRRLRAWVRRRWPAADRVWGRIRYFADRLRYHAGVVRALPSGRMAYLRRMARTGARGLDPAVSPQRRRFLEGRASYLGSLAAWKPRFFDGILHLVECESWSARGYGASWARLAGSCRRLTVGGTHEDLLLEHGDEIGAALRGWLAETWGQP